VASVQVELRFEDPALVEMVERFLHEFPPPSPSAPLVTIADRLHPAASRLVLVTRDLAAPAHWALAMVGQGQALGALTVAELDRLGLVVSGVAVGIRSSGPRLRLLAAEVPQFSRRQSDVLTQLSRGDSNATIALTLGCSVATVKRDISEMMLEVGCTSRVELAVRAVELGLVLPHPGTRPSAG
jgi:DNA-binding NarL/FixJ family response regulator